MNWPQLEKLHKATCESALRTMANKNHDYTQGSEDVFKNFRQAERHGVQPEIGILLRVGDKIERIDTFVRKGNLAVENEGVYDAIDDIINYMILIKGMLVERQADEYEYALESTNSPKVADIPPYTGK